MRMGLGCSICGWNKCVCDLHHIVPKSEEGTDDHSNLTYVCPNCHRMIHNNKIDKIVTLEEQIGNAWKDYYNI